MKKTLTALLLTVVMFASVGLAACKKTPSTEDKTAPVITLSGDVPTAGTVGRLITLPTATASDNVDGDLTDKVRVTVAQLKADGSVNDEVVDRKPANVAQTFTPNSNTMNKYTITYYVTDNAGNRAEKISQFTASEDTEAPEITIDLNSVSPALVLETGLSGRAGVDIVFPTATGIDQPGSVDITGSVQIRTYLKDGDNLGTMLGSVITGTATNKSARLPQGSYYVVYSLKDGGGNAAEDIKFPLTVAAADLSKNMIRDSKNFTFDPREGMSGFNEFGELIIGHTSKSDPEMDQPLGASMNTMKIFEEYVGITFQADPPPAKGGQSFYDFIARGSKDRATLPTYNTCEWPPYMFLRIQAASGLIDPRISSSPDKEFTKVKTYNGNIFDGNTHTMFIQWLNSGTSASDPAAKITLRGWIDVLPTAETSFEFSVVSGESTDSGVLEASIFEQMYNENTGAGWLTFGSAAMGGKNDAGYFDDDHMRIKGVSIYPKTATTFDVDITAPVLTAAELDSEVFASNEVFVLPTVTADDNGTDVTSKLSIKYSVNGGDYVAVTTSSVTFTENGAYRLVYTVADAAGNIGYHVYNFDVSARDTVLPVITVDTTAINATAGTAFTIPVATASDDQDGDITSNIVVNYTGPQSEVNITRNNKTDFVPYALGAHKIVYTVSDSFKNVATKEITVNVTGEKTGELLQGTSLDIAGGPGRGYDGQYVYDKKVSMIVNVETNGLFQFNVRGLYNNSEWPEGVILRTNSGNFELSAYKHDSIIYGTAENPYATAWKRGVDTLLEYQFSEVTVDGVVYMKFQLWFQGSALKWIAAGNNGLINIEGGAAADAIYRRKDAFTGSQAEALNAGPFFVTSYTGLGGIMEIKQLRIDGTSCTKPADPAPPAGLNKVDLTKAHGIVGTLPTANKGTQAKLADTANEDRMLIGFKADAAGSVDFLFNITGTGGTSLEWHGGILLHISNDGVYLETKARDGKVAKVEWTPYASANDNVYYIAFRLTYEINTSDLVSGLKVELWHGSSEANMILATFTDAVATDSSVVTDNGKSFTMNYADLDQENISAGPVRLMTPASQTPISIREVKIANEVAAGLSMTDLNLPTQAPSFDSTAQAISSGNAKTMIGSYAGYTVKFKLDVNSLGQDSLVLALTGTPTNADWGTGSGVTLTLRNDNAWCITYGGRNDSFADRFWIPEVAAGGTYYFAIKVTYVADSADSDVLAGVKIELWYGDTEDGMSKKVLVSDNTQDYFFVSREKCLELGVDAMKSTGIVAGAPLEATYTLSVIGVTE